MNAPICPASDRNASTEPAQSFGRARPTSNRLTRTAATFTVAAAALLASLPVTALAQSVVTQTEPPMIVFERWLRVLEVVPTPPQPAAVVVISASPVAAVTATPFEPLPVILGEPELPLAGMAGVAVTSPAAWPSNLNYQGMQVAYLVPNAAGGALEARPLSAPPRKGERFKIRVTTTFDAHLRVNALLGDNWSPQRAASLYPAQAATFRAAAGRTVDLPAEPDRYFMIADASAPRLLLSVHHERADEANRTRQPAYRRDLSSVSTFLQLVPTGTRPALEQMITAAP